MCTTNHYALYGYGLVVGLKYTKKLCIVNTVSRGVNTKIKRQLTYAYADTQKVLMAEKE